jgi:hypothetical protein
LNSSPCRLALGRLPVALCLASGSCLSALGLLAAILWLPACAGCKPPEEIRTYSIPKEPEVAAKPEIAVKPEQELPPGRMLGAIVVRPEKGWFFKLLGPTDAVAAHEDEFHALLKSLSFTADGSPKWEAPAGWQEEPASGMRFATFKIPADGKPLELTVTNLSHGSQEEADYVLVNVNRWRNQLQLGPIEKDQLPTETKQVELDGFSATTVNLEGKLAPSGMGSPPFAPGGR